MSSAADTDLVQAQAGDRDALDRLLRAHLPMVHAICRRMTGNDSDAEDATQEALIAIARGLRRFDQRAKFSTWAYRVTVNACLDELRRRRRRPTPVHDAGLDRPDAAAGPESAVARADVHSALAALDGPFRAAVVLRDLCDLDYAEIAEILDVPPGTVRSRISRGRAALAAHVHGNPDADLDRPSPYR